MVLDLQLMSYFWTFYEQRECLLFWWVWVSSSYCALFPSSLFSATQNPFSQTVFLLIYYFTNILSRRNKKVYATNSTLKSSKTTRDCWNSWGKDLQRNCPENKDLFFQPWAPMNESISEQELILTWSHFPAQVFSTCSGELIKRFSPPSWKW